MKIKENQIYNLMNTNGRRMDVTNAFSGYISILDDVTCKKKLKWGSVPESLAQYEFYRQTIELFPDVFREHKYYDLFNEKLSSSKPAKKALYELDLDSLIKCGFLTDEVIDMFDKGIEDRARHYTSNLCKLGFADSKRCIGEAGRLLLEPEGIIKDKIEQLLPIDSINILYLRQLLKLRIFDNDGYSYVSPFCLALYILLSVGRISEEKFFRIIQTLNPYMTAEQIEKYAQGEEGIFFSSEPDIPEEIRKDDIIDKNSFDEIFKNRKSEKTAYIYFEFYKRLFRFYKDNSDKVLEELLSYYEKNKYVINKAFGSGKNLLKMKNGISTKPDVFIKDNEAFFKDGLNKHIYESYIISKRFDGLREYSDTTKRIFKATGIISFDKGYVELAYKELSECIFDKALLKRNIYGNIVDEMSYYYESYDDYEGDSDSFFLKSYSMTEILQYTQESIDCVYEKIKETFESSDKSDIEALMRKQRRKEFEEHIQSRYPKEKIKLLLNLFKDRRNDQRIKQEVTTEANIPTIYEYVVGIAWYYFSDKTIDLLDSFNLTMSADFEPLLHAGGGQGDIVINEGNRVIMLEATLMDKGSQKRGEWEPVLRHSVNLKAKTELSNDNTQREVYSFFIADEFDSNTINIWKAISSVPLQSSFDPGLFTENVIIMPVSSDELCQLMDKSDSYNQIINIIKELFERDKQSFDLNWREKFISILI